VFADTSQLGVYQIDWGLGEPVAFAVNLSSPQESNIEPAGSLPVAEAGAGGGIETNLRARQEWWRYLAVGALLLLLLEWFVYQRATVLQIFKKLVHI
jgi:hypothetical protein